MGCCFLMRLAQRWYIRAILVFVALVFSIISLCVNCPRIFTKDNLGFDYMGIIVGALSILVAILIGWNIYTLIDVKEIRKSYEKDRRKLLEDVAKKREEMEEDINVEIDTLFFLLAAKCEGDESEYLAQSINSLYKTRNIYKKNSVVREICLDFSLYIIQTIADEGKSVADDKKFVSMVRSDAVIYLKKELLNFGRDEIKEKYDNVEDTLNKILKQKEIINNH